MVGVTRFELVTSRPPDARATKLRYTPNKYVLKKGKLERDIKFTGQYINDLAI